jgi:hypothetical protein
VFSARWLSFQGTPATPQVTVSANPTSDLFRSFHCSLVTLLSRANSKPMHALTDAITLVQSGFVAGLPSNSALHAEATTVTMPPTPNNVVLQLALILFLLFSCVAAAPRDGQIPTLVEPIVSRASKNFHQQRFAA